MQLEKVGALGHQSICVAARGSDHELAFSDRQRDRFQVCLRIDPSSKIDQLVRMRRRVVHDQHTELKHAQQIVTPGLIATAIGVQKNEIKVIRFARREIIARVPHLKRDGLFASGFGKIGDRHANLRRIELDGVDGGSHLFCGTRQPQC